MFPWYRAHVRLLCLLWIVIHTGRQPWPYINFTVRKDFWKSTLLFKQLGDRFHVVPFSKCTYACYRTFFVGNAYASPLSPTFRKFWFLWTEFSTYKWRMSTMPRASILWTGFCELSRGVVTLWTRKWKPYRALSRINLNCTTGYNTIRVFERWSTFNPASAIHDTPAHVPLTLLSPLLLTSSVTPYFLRSSDPSLPLPARFWPSGDFLWQTTLACSFLWETTTPSFFGSLQHGSTSRRPWSQPSHFLQRFILVRSLQSSQI